AVVRLPLQPLLVAERLSLARRNRTSRAERARPIFLECGGEIWTVVGGQPQFRSARVRPDGYRAGFRCVRHRRQLWIWQKRPPRFGPGQPPLGSGELLAASLLCRHSREAPLLE